MNQPTNHPNNQSNYNDEYVTALVDRAVSDDPMAAPLPLSLAAKIIADGQAMVAEQQRKDSLADRLRRWWQQPVLAWSVAVACLALALTIGTGPTMSDDPLRSLQKLDAALASQAAATQLPWSGMGDPRFANVSGYVRWSDETQQGVMRLSGLPINDPDEAQYQLWIVDPSRDANPVDGGVFDIKDGENLIAINAKLAVNEPKAFALTLEKPGGVVVSAGPLLVIASG